MTPTTVPVDAAILSPALFADGGVEVAPGVWALASGDADDNGSVQASGRQTLLDPNVGRASQVPGAATLTGAAAETARTAPPADAPDVRA